MADEPTLADATKGLLTRYRLNVVRRVLAGDEVNPSEIAQVTKLDDRLSGLQELEELNAMTRHPMRVDECQGTTKAGKACRSRPRKGERFCVQHGETG